ncbi:hypothetical protein NC653_032769 [Populus alba x Populus x berolinensis]|uniref:C2 domain-containing protein n=1 Tax=Populus alba x Populus x berolinensis TaxID=444605 RepID=A0AAD6LSB7_9ROSI|nr:hypothetical protein NC653_032769 [Populus alba x Populus x berolinensis]
MGSIGKVLIASGEMLSYSVGAKDVSVLVLCPLELILHIQMQSHTNTHRGSTCTQMKRGILEVLLVHAKGMKHTNLIGPPVYHVIIQCGSHVHKSKASSGKDEKTWWNEKFRFDFPLADWKQLTHLKFRIMDQEFFTDGGFVGETIIYLGGIIDEGINRGVLEMMPAPYNVLLEDDTYKGEIKIGLKFITNTEVLPERTFLAQVDEPRQPICRSIINLWKLSWWKLWIHHSQRSTKNKTEEE